MPSNIGSQIVSHLGSPNSRIPLAVKDTFNIAGYTYRSYEAGGNIEAKDKLVDEVGTSAIWLAGIPLYRKLIDKTIFKAAKISPEVDYRVVKNKDYFKKAVENAPTEKIKDEIVNAGNKLSSTRNLNLLKFGLSLALTMASYFGLTKLKQAMTKKNIEKEYLKKLESQQNNKNSKYDNLKLQTSSVFEKFNNNNKTSSNPSFGSLKSVVGIGEEFVLNPIKNMIILDTGISAERVVNARNSGEKKEYAIKEGSFLFFIYGADNLIKKGLNALSKKVLKAPIDLDANVLSSDMAKNIIKDKAAGEEVKNFIKEFGNNKNSEKIYDFIFNNPNGTIAEAAKKSGVISVIEDGKSIDTRKFIDTKQIVKIAKNLDDFISAGKNASNIESYITKVKALKVGSTLTGIAACCAALGVIIPKVMYNYREKTQNGNSGFHVKEQYEKELQKKFENKV